MDGTTVTLTLIYKKRQSMSDNVTFFNVLLKRVMRALSLIRIGQHSFNPKGIHAVPQHKLESVAGICYSYQRVRRGLNVVHRRETPRDAHRNSARYNVRLLYNPAKHLTLQDEPYITTNYHDRRMNFATRQNFKDLATKEVIGISVFTRYNNKTYRVDDIAWDKNPTYEFEKGEAEDIFNKLLQATLELNYKRHETTAFSSLF